MFYAQFIPCWQSTNAQFLATHFEDAVVIADDFERSSVNVSGSSVSGTGDDAVITLKPRVQESEVVSSQTRWLTPLAKVTGLNGIRPTLKFSDYGSGAEKYHGHPWEAGRKPMFAYSIDGPWYYFDTTTIGASDITFRHNTAFTADSVYISKGRVRTPTQTGAWINGLEATYPSLVHTLPSTVSGFVSGTFAAQTDELGRTIPAQPFYAFKISDASLTPVSGSKQAMVFVAGVHAGEDQGDIAMAAAVEFLLTSDAKAQNIRRHFDVYVYPLLNAPGRAGGGWRGSFTQGAAGIDDANRHFSDVSPGLEIVTLPRAAMTADLPAHVPVMIDWHGQYADRYAYYNDGLSEHTAFDSAIEVYLGASQYLSLGTSNAGFVAKYFQSNYSTKYYITTELGDPTPITDANITAFGEAHIKALSDIQEAGGFELPFDWNSDAEAWDADSSAWEANKQIQTVGASAILQKTQSATLSASGVLQKSGLQTSNASGILVQTALKTTTVSAFLQSLSMKTLEASANLQTTSQKIAQASAIILLEGTGLATTLANAVLQPLSVPQISCTASASLLKNILTTVSASAIISQTGWTDDESVEGTGWINTPAIPWV